MDKVANRKESGRRSWQTGRSQEGGAGRQQGVRTGWEEVKNEAEEEEEKRR